MDWERFLQVFDGNGNRGFAAVGNLSRQHFKKNNPQGVNIRFYACLFPAGLLRGKIMHRTQDCSVVGNGGGCGGPGYAEISHFDAFVITDQDVVRFYIPVNNTVLVGVVRAIAICSAYSTAVSTGKGPSSSIIAFRERPLHIP